MLKTHQVCKLVFWWLLRLREEWFLLRTDSRSAPCSPNEKKGTITSLQIFGKMTRVLAKTYFLSECVDFRDNGFVWYFVTSFFKTSYRNKYSISKDLKRTFRIFSFFKVIFIYRIFWKKLNSTIRFKKINRQIISPIRLNRMNKIDYLQILYREKYWFNKKSKLSGVPQSILKM